MRKVLTAAVVALAMVGGVPVAAFATDATAEGRISVDKVIKRAGEPCQTGVTDKCKVGQLCFLNLMIEGDAAKELYLALKAHGVMHDDSLGDFVSTKGDGAMCTEIEPGRYRCDLGYDARANTLTSAQYCEAE